MRRAERRDLQFSVERDVHRTVVFYVRGNMTAQRYIHEIAELMFYPTLVTRATLEFFEQNRVNFLPSPPRSPDSSPIGLEHYGEKTVPFTQSFTDSVGLSP